jgi:prepilin-type N-terminal cleavage/methylation domain-containing protein
MVFAKQNARCVKAGYTLVEVLVVVSIMGILSAMGVAGLQRAVANARIKDAAVNTAAFIERVANLANQRNEVLCLRVAPGSNSQKLYVVRDAGDETCANPSSGIIDSLVIDAPCKYISLASCGAVDVDWFSTSYSSDKAFKPRLGLSAAPPQGGICIQYGDDGVYGAVLKEKLVNRVKPMWKVGNDPTSGGWSSWTEL